MSRKITLNLLKEQVSELEKLVKLKDSRILELEKKILEQDILKFSNLPEPKLCNHVYNLINGILQPQCMLCGTQFLTYKTGS